MTLSSLDSPCICQGNQTSDASQSRLESVEKSELYVCIYIYICVYMYVHVYMSIVTTCEDMVIRYGMSVEDVATNRDSCQANCLSFSVEQRISCPETCKRKRVAQKADGKLMES